jgi:hypothetical protein
MSDYAAGFAASSNNQFFQLDGAIIYQASLILLVLYEHV